MLTNIRLFVLLFAIFSVLVHVFFTCSPYIKYGSNIATVGTDNYIISDVTPYPCPGSTDSKICTFKTEKTAAQICDRDSSCIGYFNNMDGNYQLFKNVPNTVLPVPSTHNIAPTSILFNMNHLTLLKLKPFVANV
jgi:hypothetical protein